MTPLVILGCGYVGTRIAKTAAAQGRSVRVASRSTGRLQPLTELGIEVKFLDAGTPKNFTAALASQHGCTVVYSIPPVTTLPPGSAMRAALRQRGVGTLTIKKRGVDVVPDQLRKRLALTGDTEATIVLTRVAGHGTALLVRPL